MYSPFPKTNPTTRWWGFFCGSSDAMATATHIPAQLAADLTNCLHRLRMARNLDDQREQRVLEMRLNWLLDKVDRKGKPC